MKAKQKFLIGGFIILGTATTLAFTSTKETAQYYLTPAELAVKVADDASFRENGVKVGGKVVPGSIQRDPSGRSLTFVMMDTAQKAVTFPVSYRGIAPDTFTDGVDVVVEGRLGADGTFRATTLLAKCASRYENAPDRPGYQQGTPGGQHPAGVPMGPAAPATSQPAAPATT
jgi:cytochrome c-type biogenesis protein CcmE